ncbi:MAG: hypothetical protein M3011_00090 [Actinomycetota bacterium]|nr:hypothetical protein [Actinomycetota bacterium]
MYDYVDGKVDWMAYGLPVEGDDGPFVGQAVTDAVAVEVGSSVGQARRRLEESGYDVAIVIHEQGWVVGEVDAEILAGPDDGSLLEVMRPVPSTVRPSATVSSLAGSAGERLVVSTSDGRLLGQAVVEAEYHDGHHHDGHDHADQEASSGRLGRMEQELTEVMEAVADHFGDGEPSDEELRSFLLDRLVAEGRSPEEADQFMAGIDDQNHG